MSSKLINIKVLLSRAAFLLAVSLQTAAAGGPGLEAQVRDALDAFRAQYGFPGATAAIALPDGTTVTAATGLADVEAGLPMAPESRMLAASIGKSFVGAEVVALAREGLLSLDDPAAKHLGDRPWFARLANHEAIRVEHLLYHTSGLQDHVHMDSFARAVAENWRDTATPFRPEDLVAYLLDQPALFAPGEGWAYTDTGYILLGLIIEKAAGKTYFEEVARRFIGPLGLTLTTPQTGVDIAGLAPGYTAPDNPRGLPAKSTSAPGVMAWNPAFEWTGGGLVSNSRDLALWARALYGGAAMDGPYLADLLASAPVGSEDSGVRYGAGVAIYETTPLGPVYGHGGDIPGYISSMRYYPDHGVAVAFQVNTDIGFSDDGDTAFREMELGLARLAVSAAETGD